MTSSKLTEPAGLGTVLRAVICVTWVLLCPQTARAEDAVELTWDAPPGCPQASAVRERLRTLRGAPTRTSRLRAEGRIVRVGGRYRLTLGVHEGADVLERKIDAESCKDLAGAAAVALALLLRDEENRETAATPRTTPETSPEAEPRDGTPVEPQRDEPTTPPTPATKEPSPPERKPEAQRPKEVAPPVEPPKPATPDAGTERSWRLLLRPIASIDIGPLPDPNPGLGLGLGWKLEPWSVLIVGRKTWPATVTSPWFTGANAEFERMMLELWVCRSFRAGAVDGGPCFAVGGERIAATGSGRGVTSAADHALILVLGGGVGGRLHVSNRFAFAANANVLVATSRPRFVIDELGQVYQSKPVSLSLALGVELAL